MSRALAVAAPAVFAVLQAHDPVAGRAIAGDVFGSMLLRYQHMLWTVGVLQVVLLGTRAALGPVPRRYKWQVMIMAAMLGATSYSALVIAPRIDAIRSSTATTVAALPDDSPLKQEFGRLHGMSTGLLALALSGAIAMLWFDARE